MGWKNAVGERYGSTSFVELTEEARILSPAKYYLSAFANELVESLFELGPVSLDQACLEDFCKVQAVQDISSGEALAIIFDLKNVIYSILRDVQLTGEQILELRRIEQEIDFIALRAFSNYTEQKVRIVQIKNNELNRLNRSNQQ